MGREGATCTLGACRAAQSNILGVGAAVGPSPKQDLMRCCQRLNASALMGHAGAGSFCWLVCALCIRQSGGASVPRVPEVPGASQCLLVTSFITMPSASTVMAAATASPRRTISSLVDMVLPGGSPWGSGWKVAPSSLVMAVSTTPFCASTPAAIRRGWGQRGLLGFEGFA